MVEAGQAHRDDKGYDNHCKNDSKGINLDEYGQIAFHRYQKKNPKDNKAGPSVRELTKIHVCGDLDWLVFTREQLYDHEENWVQELGQQLKKED
jgi:hypothetical protein